MICTLCSNKNLKILNINNFTFWFCNKCFLIFRDKKHYLSLDEEKTRYLKHNNDPSNPNYSSYLMKNISPCLDALDKTASILDYGSGPTKGIEHILKNKAYKVESYDPFFHNIILDKKYDLVIAHEVIEHFKNVQTKFEKLVNLLKSSSVLGVKTSMWNDNTDLDSWYYMNDRTHVSFFHEKTFQYICKIFHLQLFQENNDIKLFSLR